MNSNQLPSSLQTAAPDVHLGLFPDFHLLSKAELQTLLTQGLLQTFPLPQAHTLILHGTHRGAPAKPVCSGNSGQLPVLTSGHLLEEPAPYNTFLYWRGNKAGHAELKVRPQQP